MGGGVERWAVRGREGGVHKVAPSNTGGTVTAPCPEMGGGGGGLGGAGGFGGG